MVEYLRELLSRRKHRASTIGGVVEQNKPGPEETPTCSLPKSNTEIRTIGPSLAVNTAEHGVRADEWALLNDFFGAGQRWAYSISDATYSELLSAGRLDLIPDAALRKQLADYYLSKRDQTAFLADPRRNIGTRLGR